MSHIIKVENLGKKYTIGHHRKDSYLTLRDAIAHQARGLWQKIVHPLSPNREEVQLEDLWALKDINFEVHPGDRLGIIGHNGAGKSTLLKILSRITRPTTGRVRLRGWIGSLLEVGTGFHPELTGRENIYLNGAILGMTHQEIKKKFEEIVAFAEVEKFLDTPVKRYSSGMYVRLAFAVAAHLEPEILVIDEVLAVGDAQFQEKCLKKMNSVAKEGRTILFVSHNMQAIKELCPKSILLNNGRNEFMGTSEEVIKTYLKDFSMSKKSFKSTGTRFISVGIYDDKGKLMETVTSQQIAYLIFKVFVEQSRNINMGFTLYSGQNVPLLSASVLDDIESIPPGATTFRIKLPTELLLSGGYRVEGALWDPYTVYDQNEYLTTFNFLRYSHNDRTGMGYKGLLIIPSKWELVVNGWPRKQ